MYTLIIGVKKTGDLLEKLTWGFIIAIMVLCLTTTFIAPNQGGSSNDVLERAGEQAPAPQAPPNLNLEPDAAPADTTPK